MQWCSAILFWYIRQCSLTDTFQKGCLAGAVHKILGVFACLVLFLRSDLVLTFCTQMPDYPQKRKGRKRKLQYDPALLEVDQLTGQENVSAVKRLTGTKVRNTCQLYNLWGKNTRLGIIYMWQRLRTGGLSSDKKCRILSDAEHYAQRLTKSCTFSHSKVHRENAI